MQKNSWLQKTGLATISLDGLICPWTTTKMNLQGLKKRQRKFSRIPRFWWLSESEVLTLEQEQLLSF